MTSGRYPEGHYINTSLLIREISSEPFMFWSGWSERTEMALSSVGLCLYPWGWISKLILLETQLNSVWISKHGLCLLLGQLFSCFVCPDGQQVSHTQPLLFNFQKVWSTEWLFFFFLNQHNHNQSLCPSTIWWDTAHQIINLRDRHWEQTDVTSGA